MNNIRQPAEPKPEVVECAIVELLEMAKRQGITPAEFIQLLDSGMHISDFLAAMSTHYCWFCGQGVSLETCKVDEHGRAVHEACVPRGRTSPALRVALTEPIGTQSQGEPPTGDASDPAQQ